MTFKRMSLIGLLIATVIVGYFYFAFNFTGSTFTNSSASVNGPDNSIWDTAFGGIFASPGFNDTLPNYQYKKLEELFKKNKERKEQIDGGLFMSGWGIGTIGIFSIPNQYPFSNINDSIEKFRLNAMDSLTNILNKENDTNRKAHLQILIDSLFLSSNMSAMISKNNAGPSNEKDNLFYFALNNYKLKDGFTKFYIDKGIYNLAIVKWDSIVRIDSLGYDTTGHYINKRINVRYSEHNKKILIPLSISKKTFNNVNLLLKILTALFTFFSVYIFIGLPFQILLNISRGKAFTVKNIKYLKIITIAACVISLLGLGLPYIMDLIFKNRIPDEIAPATFMEILSDNFRMIIFSISMLFISKAFIKGYKLQKEQDLTI